MNIKITEPCPEDWNKMKIGLISRHCDQCDKPVIDFTKMDRAEIIIYLLSNPTTKTCGRMSRDQFDFHHDDIPLLIEGLKKKGGNASFLILALVCVSLVSCKEDNRKTTIKTPNPIHQNYGGEGTLGEVSMPNDRNQTKKIVPEHVPEHVLEPSILPEPIIMGEPVMVGDIQLVEPPEKIAPPDEVLSYAEKMPEYPGGVAPLFAFVKEHLVYPEFEKENGIEGTVYVKFIVTEEGKVVNPEVVRGVNGAPNFNKEVLRIINKMSNWIPGENNGKKVKVYFTMPFKFRLN
jgi:TonB family protein